MEKYVKLDIEDLYGDPITVEGFYTPSEKGVLNYGDGFGMPDFPLNFELCVPDSDTIEKLASCGEPFESEEEKEILCKELEEHLQSEAERVLANEELENEYGKKYRC